MDNPKISESHRNWPTKSYKHKMVKKTWAESARWILHQDVRDATWTCHTTWRLEGLASENVILEQVVWLLKKLTRSAPHNRLLLSSHRQGLLFLTSLKCVCLWASSTKKPQQTRRTLIKDTSKGLVVPQYHGHLVLHGAVTPTAFAERGIKRRSCHHCTELKAEIGWRMLKGYGFELQGRDLKNLTSSCNMLL